MKICTGYCCFTFVSVPHPVERTCADITRCSKENVSLKYVGTFNLHCLSDLSSDSALSLSIDSG